MLDSRFSQACEAAAIEWNVPALAIGTSVGGEIETLSAGCDVETLFRVASITKPFTAMLTLELLDPQAKTGVWPAEPTVERIRKAKRLRLRGAGGRSGPIRIR